ncbi:MAG: nucleoside kinase [Oscillospiraceae bacterium]|nr:nucleoside kinase [Oscillospiraceae bacterium]
MKYIRTNYLKNEVIQNELELIRHSEENYYNQLKEVCGAVYENRETRPIVLISGPSGSGKTSTANELSRLLMEKYSCKSSVVSLDNYFRSNDSPDMPLDENGNIDLESPYCTDLELLQEHINLLNECRDFEMPVFDFKKQARGGYIPFKREPGSIVIMEGIHALNPLVTGENSFAWCVYVSVRTRLKADNGKLLHPRAIRLMRRLCRDNLFRGRDFEAIFHFFESVSKGEDKFILPFKHRANFQIDTFMAYEAPAYRAYLYDKLKDESDKFTENELYKKLMTFFEFFPSMSKQNIPKTSLVREFIGF